MYFCVLFYSMSVFLTINNHLCSVIFSDVDLSHFLFLPFFLSFLLFMRQQSLISLWRLKSKLAGTNINPVTSGGITLWADQQFNVNHAAYYAYQPAFHRSSRSGPLAARQSASKHFHLHQWSQIFCCCCFCHCLNACPRFLLEHNLGQCIPDALILCVEYCNFLCFF